MKRFLIAAALCLHALPAWAQMAPGTVKLLSKNATLVDTITGDAFFELKDDASAKFLVIGPEVLQADVRINLPAGQATGTPTVFVVLAGGKEVARYKVTPKAGTDSWKGRVDVKPSISVGFYVDVEAGPKAFEFKVLGAAKGAGLLLVAKAKARKPLAAGAPVVSSKPVAVPVATATPRVVGVSPTPKPTAIPVGTPVSMESLVGKGPTADQLRRERRTYDTMIKLGYATPSQSDFAGSPVAGGEARWAFGKHKSIAAGLEVMTLGFSAIVPDDPALPGPPTAVDVTLLPVSVSAIYLVQLESSFQPYLGVGGTLAYGSSAYRQLDRPTIAESLVGFGGQIAGGLAYDFSGTDLAEGGQKVFVEVKGTYLNVPFEAHDFTDWSTVQVLGGVSIKF